MMPDLAAPPPTDAVAARRRQLRAALALRGMTSKAFIHSLGVTTTHFYAVLAGERESAKIDAAIRAVIADTFPSSSHA